MKASHLIILVSMLFVGSACGQIALNQSGAASASTTGAGSTDGSSVGAGSTVTTLDSTGDSYLDPATSALASVANANTVAGQGNTVAGQGNTTADANAAVCKTAIEKLRADDANLRGSADFTAAQKSTEFQAVLTAAKAAEAAGCRSILTASTDCQTDITAVDTAVQAFWKSAAFTTLEASAEFKAVQADVTALNGLTCFDGARGNGGGFDDGGQHSHR